MLTMIANTTISTADLSSLRDALFVRGISHPEAHTPPMLPEQADRKTITVSLSRSAVAILTDLDSDFEDWAIDGTTMYAGGDGYPVNYI